MTEKLGNPFKISELIETVNNLVDTTIDDSNLVHKTGNETISGVKTFASGSPTSLITKSDKIDSDIKPSSTQYSNFIDGYDVNGKLISRIFTRKESNGKNGIAIQAWNGSTNYILGVNSDGTSEAPTPPASDNSTKIATTAFVKAQGYAVDSGLVHKSGDETITGSKTFTNYQYIKNVDCSIANPPASTSWKYIDCIDSNGVRIGVIGSPSASDNSTKIATTAWVKNQGYMSSGNIFPNNTWVPVGDDAYMGDHNQSGGVCIKGNNNNTAIYLFRRDETASNGFRLDENDANGLKIINPTQGAQAWCAVTAMIAESYGSNGYIKFNHGLIIQWLYFAVSNNYVTVTFPTSFSNTNYAIVQTPISNNGTFPGGAWTGIRDKTMTNVKLGIRAGAGVGADTSYSHAIAIGY